MRKIAFLMVLAAVAGCAGSKTATRAPNGFVEGKAKVLELDNNLGMAMLDFKGKRTPAYWNAEVVKPFHVSAVDTHQTTPRPTQDLSETKDAIQPVEESVVLPAKVGDTVEFRAMWTGGELFLRSVQVVSN